MKQQKKKWWTQEPFNELLIFSLSKQLLVFFIVDRLVDVLRNVDVFCESVWILLMFTDDYFFIN